MRAAALLLVVGACHVVTREATTRRGPVRAEPSGPPALQPPTIELGPGGRLRLVAPRRCPVVRVLDATDVEVAQTRPNLAAFVVGVVASGLGSVALIAGATSDDATAHPATWGGLGLLAAGLPLAVGPWIRHRRDEVPGPVRREVLGVDSERCGDAPLPGPAWISFDAYTAWVDVERDGSIEPTAFDWVDAHDAGRGRAWAVRARDAADVPAWSAEVALDAQALLRARGDFLAERGDATPPAAPRVLPMLVTDGVQVMRTRIGDATGLRVILPLTNDGAGDAWQVRAHVQASHPELDGRVLYVGHIARGATVRPELRVRLSPAAAQALLARPLDLSLTLHDAHDAAPTAAITFRGLPLGEFPTTGAP